MKKYQVSMKKVERITFDICVDDICEVGAKAKGAAEKAG